MELSPGVTGDFRCRPEADIRQPSINIHDLLPIRFISAQTETLARIEDERGLRRKVRLAESCSTWVQLQDWVVEALTYIMALSPVAGSKGCKPTWRQALPRSE